MNEDSQIAPIFKAQKHCVIFIGIQASGKTTFYQRFCAATHAHINLDTLNTRNKEMLAISECLASGKSFVVDNTNPTKTDRARYIPLVKGAGYEVMGFYFRSILAEFLLKSRTLEDTSTLSVPQGTEYPRACW